MALISGNAGIDCSQETCYGESRVEKRQQDTSGARRGWPVRSRKWLRAASEAFSTARGNGEVDGGGRQGRASGLLGEPDTAVDAAKRRVHPEGEGVCPPAGHPGEGRWRQQGVDCVSERVTDRRAAGERGEKIDEASRVTDETNWTMRPSEIGTAFSAGVPVRVRGKRRGGVFAGVD